jgi:hypothetical protein
MKRGNRSFENVSHFEYLGATITNQNLVQNEAPIAEGPHVTALKEAKGSRVSKLAQRNIDF